MKKTVIITVITGLLMTAGTAVADHSHKWQNKRHYDYARVIKVKPVYRVVNVPVERRECQLQEVHNYRYRNIEAEGTAFGAALGGVFGHHFGKKRVGPTVAGVIVGATLGNALSNGKHGYTDEVRYEKVCEIVTDYRREKQLDGYRVTYRYRGQHYKTRTDYHPGKRIKIKVHVSPVVH